MKARFVRDPEKLLASAWSDASTGMLLALLADWIAATSDAGKVV